MEEDQPVSNLVKFDRQLAGPPAQVTSQATALATDIHAALAKMANPDDISVEVDAYEERGRSSLQVRMRAYKRPTPTPPPEGDT
jgi:hypothetical protein